MHPNTRRGTAGAPANGAVQGHGSAPGNGYTAGTGGGAGTGDAPCTYAAGQLPDARRELAESVARIDARQDLATIVLRPAATGWDAGELDNGQPSGWDPSGWQNCAWMLARPAALTAWRELAASWLHEQFGDAPEHTTAAYVRSWYLQVPAYAATLMFHHERRVPSLRAEDLSFRVAAAGKPSPSEIALHGEAFACLPTDSAAGAPGVQVVDTEAQLAELLRASFAAHAGRFVRTYRPLVRFGRHALWAAATDALDIGMWRAGKQAGDERAAVADARILLPNRIAPFSSPSTLRPAGDGEENGSWTRRKEACCFSYLVENGKGPCATCPRVVPVVDPAEARPAPASQ